MKSIIYGGSPGLSAYRASYFSHAIERESRVKAVGRPECLLAAPVLHPRRRTRRARVARLVSHWPRGPAGWGGRRRAGVQRSAAGGERAAVRGVRQRVARADAHGIRDASPAPDRQGIT